MDPNRIVNNAYHSAVLSGLVITNSVLATKLLKIKSVDLGKFSVKDGAMLSANIYVAMMIKKCFDQARNFTTKYKYSYLVFYIVWFTKMLYEHLLKLNMITNYNS